MPNVGPYIYIYIYIYIYTTLAFLALLGAPYIYEISSLRVKYASGEIRIYRGADKSLARPTSRCILFDGENISFHASLVIYTNSTNIPSIMIISRIYENQNRLLL